MARFEIPEGWGVQAFCFALDPSPEAITLAAAEAGLLTAQQEVFTNPAPVIPARNEPVPPAGPA